MILLLMLVAEKSAITFGDLPDCSMGQVLAYHKLLSNQCGVNRNWTISYKVTKNEYNTESNQKKLPL